MFNRPSYVFCVLLHRPVPRMLCKDRWPVQKTKLIVCGISCTFCVVEA